MEEKEIIWQKAFQADIFDPDFCKQLKLEQAKLPPTEQPFYYNLDIQVPLAALRQTDRIEAYPLHNPLRYEEKPDKFGDILSEHARGVEDIFQNLGFLIQYDFIFGEPMDNPHEVILTLWKGKPKEYFANGALKPVYRTTVVIPSRLGFWALLQKTLAKHYARMEEKHFQETLSSPVQPSQTILLGELLQIIAQELSSSAVNPAETEHITAALKENCCIENYQPLSIEGQRNKLGRSEDMSEEIICPEWLIYAEKKNLSWTISETRSGTDAQRELERLWKRKTTNHVITLHNLKPIGYSLMAKTEHGFTRVPKESASLHSSLEVVWDETID